MEWDRIGQSKGLKAEQRKEPQPKAGTVDRTADYVSGDTFLTKTPHPKLVRCSRNLDAPVEVAENWGFAAALNAARSAPRRSIVEIEHATAASRHCCP